MRRPSVTPGGFDWSI